jgi:predicted dithiol-disulfide oxidoreductase (DUF899 family)
MTAHTIGTREEWLAARVDLLAEEKELTRRSDDLARKRQALPWVAVEKEYAFETHGGKKTRGTDVLNATWQLLDRRAAATTRRAGRSDTTNT